MRLTNNKFILTTIISTFILIIATLLPKYAEASQGRDYNLATNKHISADTTKPDFASMKDVNQKKKAFIEYMLAAIHNVNKEICTERAELKKLTNAMQKNKKLSSSQQKQLDKYSDYYRVKDSHTTQEKLELLDKKIGTAPTSFILAQAILESGWGSSRFAKNHNNYFGLHCFRSGCGEKAREANVYLEVFENATQSVFGYYYRLNTGSSFKGFRDVRYKVNQGKLPATELFNTLESYSELGGNEYKSRLEGIIKYNKLTQYDDTKTC